MPGTEVPGMGLLSCLSLVLMKSQVVSSTVNDKKYRISNDVRREQ